MHETDILTYFNNLMLETYGEDEFREIRKILWDLPNGVCGVETSVSTFPKLLALKGITPTRSYSEEFGVPENDGHEAATLEQREVIIQALVMAGYNVA